MKIPSKGRYAVAAMMDLAHIDAGGRHLPVARLDLRHQRRIGQELLEVSACGDVISLGVIVD